MSYPTNSIIDSGMVEAPPASINGHQTSPTTAAPSQASQDSTASTYENRSGINHPTHDHQLNPHAYETGTASHSHPAGKLPFQPMGSTHNEEQHIHAPPPPLPPREDGAQVADGVSNPNGAGVGGHPHGPPHVRRGDYASGAANTTGGTHLGTSTGHPSTTAETGVESSTGAGTGVGVGAGTDNRNTRSKIKEGASGIKGVVAAVHGAGETLRGTFNREVDRAFHDKDGELKNDRIARDGEAEIQGGRFGNSTKNREGVVPGSDGERRL